MQPMHPAWSMLPVEVMGNSTPSVSVIVPAYNTASYIGKALESLLGQTLQDFEVVVVDDASTDTTRSVVKAFRDRFAGRLTLLVNTHNSGVSVGRNRAFQQARGTWIALLDSDDWYASQRLENLVDVAERHRADLVADNLAWVSQDQVTSEICLLPDDVAPGAEVVPVDVADALRPVHYGHREMNLGYAKPIIRREFLSRHGIAWNERLRFHEDAHFLLDCLSYGAKLLYVRRAYYFYRTRPDSLTAHHHYEQTRPWLTEMEALLSKEIVSTQPALAAALRVSFTAVERRYAGATLAALLRRHAYRAALLWVIRRPAALPALLRRVLTGLRYRFGIPERRATVPEPRNDGTP